MSSLRTLVTAMKEGKDIERHQKQLPHQELTIYHVAEYSHASSPGNEESDKLTKGK